MNDAPPALSAARTSWHRRHPKWFGWAIGAGAFVVLIAMTLLMLAFVFGFMKSSDAYTGALARVRSAPVVVTAIGAPIKEGWFVTGNINVSGPTGLAELAIPISGPRGDAIIYVDAKKRLGEWQFDHLIVQIKKTHERIDLSPPSAKAPPQP